MRQYNYIALDENGNEQSGFMEANDQNRVLQLLRQRGLYVLNLDEDQQSIDEEEKQEEFIEEFIGLLPVLTSQKVFFFKQLALMLRSGMSITEAFDILVKMQRGRMRQISLRINRRIKSGESFSKAMSEHVSIFSNLAVNMIYSAETSGDLDIALMRIARYLEHKAALRKQLLSAMMYPAFTLLAAIAVFVFMLVYIIPKFQDFLLSTGKKVPPSTQLMIDIGDFFNSNWLVLLIGLGVAIVAFVFYYKTESGKYNVDRNLLRIPVVGAAISSAAMAQLSWGMGILLKSGIPVVDSLRIIAEMIGNSAIARAVSNAADRVLHGHDLSSSFRKTVVSTLIQQLMTVGERSGNLVNIMDEASAYYEDDLQTKTKTLASMVEPIAILLIGGIVGFVYYGFFQALLSVSTRG